MKTGDLIREDFRKGENKKEKKHKTEKEGRMRIYRRNHLLLTSREENGMTHSLKHAKLEIKK